jgi:cardiolipin synthase C
LLQAHPGLSGIYPLADSEDAFAARAHLAQAAERTLDVQYYIWEDDMTGMLLFEALRAAADRGVRVRLLLDDNNTPGLDRILAALDSHPHIEVRLFNPFVLRKPRLGYLTDFSRANRRMHNKSFTADNQVTIIGGRNVGDEYFGAAEGLLFVDLDVMAVGPVVTDVSVDFDRYWASESSYPADRILPAVDGEQLAAIAAAAAQIERNPASHDYIEALDEAPFVRALLERRLEFEWATTQMISDDPAKGLGKAPPEEMFPEQLRKAIGDPVKHVELVASYFVPTAAGRDSFKQMALRGVAVQVLTNALEATDSPYVHAGYGKRREALLQAGVKLYEMRRLSPDREVGGGSGPFGSSGSSLHAKTFSVDSSRVFVGSFNFDPRSRHLNTELGFVIESPALAQKIERAFQSEIPPYAYEVRLSETGALYWLEQRDGTSIRHDTEPGVSFWLRTAVWFLSLLPIDWLL